MPLSYPIFFISLPNSQFLTPHSSFQIDLTMIPYSCFSLPNGLRVIHNEDASTAMVAVNVLYDVGARDESPELTGMAHLFEHLMFGGSANIPDFDGAIERAGGWNNAWTSNDFTNFYDMLPAVNFETALWLESDRMLSLSFSPKALEVQRHVVIEEFKQVCLNTPYGDMMHHLRDLVYKVHPYRYPTIGKEISHIERVSMEDVRDFYYRHYAPNNAVLAISGNVGLERVKELVSKWFGDVPRREIATRDYLQEPEIKGSRYREARADVPQPLLVMAFPMPGHSHPDYKVCDLLTDVLASGRSSRLYRNVVMENRLFAEADASIVGSEEPGFIMVNARLTADDDASIERARDILVSQLSDLASKGITDFELQRVLNRFDSNFTFSSVNCLAKAQSLAMARMHDEDINRMVPEYRTVTGDMIQDVARRYLRPERSETLVYRPL